MFFFSLAASFSASERDGRRLGLKAEAVGELLRSMISTPGESGDDDVEPRLATVEWRDKGKRVNIKLQGGKKGLIIIKLQGGKRKLRIE